MLLPPFIEVCKRYTHLHTSPLFWPPC